MFSPSDLCFSSAWNTLLKCLHHSFPQMSPSHRGHPMKNLVPPSYTYILPPTSVQLTRSDSLRPLWTAARQAFLSNTDSQSLLKLTSIESMMPSNHFILCGWSPSPPAFNLSQHQGLFQWVSSSHQVAKVLEFQLQHHSSIIVST